jgi:hypothetical protein
MTEYAVGWGTLALINAALANIDGRSPLTYFGASLLFGPLVTLLLAATTENARSHLHQVDLIAGRRRPTDGDQGDSRTRVHESGAP